MKWTMPSISWSKESVLKTTTVRVLAGCLRQFALMQIMGSTDLLHQAESLVYSIFKECLRSEYSESPQGSVNSLSATGCCVGIWKEDQMGCYIQQSRPDVLADNSEESETESEINARSPRRVRTILTMILTRY